MVTSLTCFRLHGTVKVPRRIHQKESGNGEWVLEESSEELLGPQLRNADSGVNGVGPFTENHHGRGCIMTPVLR